MRQICRDYQLTFHNRLHCRHLGMFPKLAFPFLGRDLLKPNNICTHFSSLGELASKKDAPCDTGRQE